MPIINQWSEYRNCWGLYKNEEEQGQDQEYVKNKRLKLRNFVTHFWRELSFKWVIHRNIIVRIVWNLFFIFSNFEIQRIIFSLILHKKKFYQWKSIRSWKKFIDSKSNQFSDLIHIWMYINSRWLITGIIFTMVRLTLPTKNRIDSVPWRWLWHTELNSELIDAKPQSSCKSKLSKFISKIMFWQFKQTVLFIVDVDQC